MIFIMAVLILQQKIHFKDLNSYYKFFMTIITINRSLTPIKLENQQIETRKQINHKSF
jgi:hypothetical protein